MLLVLDVWAVKTNMETMKTQARKQTKSPTTQQSCLTNLTMPGAKVLTILKGSGHGSIVGVGSFGMALGGWVWWKLTFRPTLCCAQGELGHESLGTKSAGFSCVGISLFIFWPETRRDSVARGSYDSSSNVEWGFWGGLVLCRRDLWGQLHIRPLR